MPAPPPPSTVQGAVVQMLRADTALGALVGAGFIVGGEVPEEFPLPFVVVHDEVTEERWISTTAREETHRLKVTCYAASAGAAGAGNPADALAQDVERVLGWQDLPIPDTVPVALVQRKRALRVSKRRAGTKERVYECEMEWDVVIGVG